MGDAGLGIPKFDDVFEIEFCHHMRITEIRVKLVDDDPARQRLRAFCSVTFDNAFVIHEIKILEGNQGYFVAMPSRKIAFRCPKCRQKNAVASNYCSHCGVRLSRSESYAGTIDSTPSQSYVDIVHPINSSARDAIHRAIISEYKKEKERVLDSSCSPKYEKYVEFDV